MARLSVLMASLPRIVRRITVLVRTDKPSPFYRLEAQESGFALAIARDPLAGASSLYGCLVFACLGGLHKPPAPRLVQDAAISAKLMGP